MTSLWRGSMATPWCSEMTLAVSRVNDFQLEAGLFLHETLCRLLLFVDDFIFKIHYYHIGHICIHPFEGGIVVVKKQLIMLLNSDETCFVLLKQKGSKASEVRLICAFKLSIGVSLCGCLSVCQPVMNWLNIWAFKKTSLHCLSMTPEQNLTLRQEYLWKWAKMQQRAVPLALWLHCRIITACHNDFIELWR